MSTLATYEVRVLCPDEPVHDEVTAFTREQEKRRIAANLPAMLEAAQESLEDILPIGWTVEIEKR